MNWGGKLGKVNVALIDDDDYDYLLLNFFFSVQLHSKVVTQRPSNQKKPGAAGQQTRIQCDLSPAPHIGLLPIGEGV